LETA